MQTFRDGLIRTNVALEINETSSHIGQTLFAPSNAAFAKLGTDANKFLFSDKGEKHLRALLKYHIVANHTLFSDMYYKPDGEGQVSLSDGMSVSPSLSSLHVSLLISQVELPTLLSPLSLNIAIKTYCSRLTIKANKAVSVSSIDVIAMDGVVHVIDSLLFPPLPDGVDCQTRRASWLDFLRFNSKPLGVSVEEIVRRLQPHIES